MASSRAAHAAFSIWKASGRFFRWIAEAVVPMYRARTVRHTRWSVDSVSLSSTAALAKCWNRVPLSAFAGNSSMAARAASIPDPAAPWASRIALVISASPSSMA